MHYQQLTDNGGYFITLTVQLCVKHDGHEATCRAGLSAASLVETSLYHQAEKEIRSNEEHGSWPR